MKIQEYCNLYQKRCVKLQITQVVFIHVSVMQAVRIPAHMFGLVGRQTVKLRRHDSVDIPVLI